MYVGVFCVLFQILLIVLEFMVEQVFVDFDGFLFLLCVELVFDFVFGVWCDDDFELVLIWFVIWIGEDFDDVVV